MVLTFANVFCDPITWRVILVVFVVTVIIAFALYPTPKKKLKGNSMGYPLDLDEYGEDALRNELTRRAKLKREGRCDYCGKYRNESVCKFPDRHSKARDKPKR